MRTRVNGVEVGYDIYGAQSSPQTLVLLHAFPLSREQWREQAMVLAQRGGIRVVTPDLPGTGESSVPCVPGEPVTVERMAEIALALLNTLGVSEFALGGLSMGGYVALAAWRAAPHRIRRLILADTRATADTPEGRAGREATAQLALQRGPLAVFERDLPKLLSPLTLNTRPDIVVFARALAAANSPQGIASVARGLALRPDATAELPSISCPALILVGEQDAITPVDDARALFARVPNAQLEVIEGAGHLSNLDQPDRFSILVDRFLRGQPSGLVMQHEA
ncbi:MAG TPA: alpha/beta hydrolase [Ktedonobacterales bacterium]